MRYYSVKLYRNRDAGGGERFVRVLDAGLLLKGVTMREKQTQTLGVAVMVTVHYTHTGSNYVLDGICPQKGTKQVDLLQSLKSQSSLAGVGLDRGRTHF